MESPRQESWARVAAAVCHVIVGMGGGKDGETRRSRKKRSAEARQECIRDLPPAGKEDASRVCGKADRGEELYFPSISKPNAVGIGDEVYGASSPREKRGGAQSIRKTDFQKRAASGI